MNERTSSQSLQANMTVSAPFYMLFVRLMVLDIRGRMTFEPGYIRWRPTGWYGRNSSRGHGFEVPLTEFGCFRIVGHRFGRADLIFEDLGGNEIKADGNRRSIRLRVKKDEAERVLHARSFVPSLDDAGQGLTRWRRG